MEFAVFVTVLLINFCNRVLSQKLDVTAFEYGRKVPTIKDKQLGHCVSKVEELFPGRFIEKACSLAPKTGSIRFVSKELNDTRIFEVRNLNDIFVCMGLCDGHASSVLGLLNTGDCLAVEIAGKLTFSQKTHILAYVEYFRSGIDYLQTDGYAPMELKHYYDGNFFLRDRSYGTMEIVILEIRYPKKNQMEALKSIRQQFYHISTFLHHAVIEVGKPSSFKLIRLSTAREKIETLYYKMKNLDDVYSKLHKYESDIFHIREDIRRQYIKPHLRYGMYPYTLAAVALRSSDHLQWEDACAAQVKVNSALKMHRRLTKKCKKIPVEQCVNLPSIKKRLKKVQKDVHSTRMKWHKLTDSEKQTVKSVNKETKRLRQQLKNISKRMRDVTKYRKTKKITI